MKFRVVGIRGKLDKDESVDKGKGKGTGKITVKIRLRTELGCE